MRPNGKRPNMPSLSWKPSDGTPLHSPRVTPTRRQVDPSGFQFELFETFTVLTFQKSTASSFRIFTVLKFRRSEAFFSKARFPSFTRLLLLLQTLLSSFNIALPLGCRRSQLNIPDIAPPHRTAPHLTSLCRGSIPPTYPCRMFCMSPPTRSSKRCWRRKRVPHTVLGIAILHTAYRTSRTVCRTSHFHRGQASHIVSSRLMSSSFTLPHFMDQSIDHSLHDRCFEGAD